MTLNPLDRVSTHCPGSGRQWVAPKPGRLNGPLLPAWMRAALSPLASLLPIESHSYHILTASFRPILNLRLKSNVLGALQLHWQPRKQRQQQQQRQNYRQTWTSRGMSCNRSRRESAKQWPTWQDNSRSWTKSWPLSKPLSRQI